MGTTSQKLTYLNETKTQIRKGLNRLGADLTSEDTFRSYAEELDEIYDSLPKVENETASESVTLTPTRKAQMTLDLLGNTQQDSTTGKNLAQRIGGYLTADGTFKTSNDDSFYFPVTQGETYTYNAIGNRTLGAIYDNIPSNNATPISGTYSNNMVKNSPFTASATGIMVIYANTPSNQDTINSFIAVKGNVIGDYEPYTNGASPNPDYPQQVHNVSGDNEIKVCGKNLLDKSAVTSGYLVARGTGELSKSGGYKASDYIPVQANVTYTQSNCDAYYSVYYDNNKNYLTYIGTATFTPSQDGYIRTTIPNAKIDLAQVEVGESASEYSDYVSQTQLISLGVENLFDKDNGLYSTNIAFIN